MQNFGQVVIGPPGSGKSTYCAGTEQFLSALGHKVAIVNLDPANATPPYTPSVDISSLISLDDAMETLDLGPNGGLIYCIEFLEKNIEWLRNELMPVKDSYLLFDFPGQVELYTHNNTLKSIVDTVQSWGVRLVAVHLLDSHYCNEAAKYVSGVLVSLSSMVSLELPQVNVLSKIDLVGIQAGSSSNVSGNDNESGLEFKLQYYSEVQDLSYLLNALNLESGSSRFLKLNRALCGVIEDYSLVSFCTLDVSDKNSMFAVLKSVDQAGGQCIFVENENEEEGEGEGGDEDEKKAMFSESMRTLRDIDPDIVVREMLEMTQDKYL